MEGREVSDKGTYWWFRLEEAFKAWSPIDQGRGHPGG